jgi:hypothetical protein
VVPLTDSLGGVGFAAMAEFKNLKIAEAKVAVEAGTLSTRFTYWKWRLLPLTSMSVASANIPVSAPFAKPLLLRCTCTGLLLLSLLPHWSTLRALFLRHCSSYENDEYHLLLTGLLALCLISLYTFIALRSFFH